MLTFEAPFYEVKNIICFRDHAVKNQFYYLAGLPRLSMDTHKKPQFTLLKYRAALDASGPPIRNREALGGAFLMLGVDCGVDDVDSITSELESKAGVADATLTPVLYTAGTVRIVALDYQPPPSGAPANTPGSHFVKAVIGSTTPSLLGDQHAIFSISLDTDAATLIEAAYENDMSPIGVIYELQFSGLRPALSVSAEVDYKRVYEQLKIDFQFGLHTGGGTSTTPTPTPTPTRSAGQGGAGGAAGGSQPSGTATPPALAQPIQIKIQTGGSLGTMAFKYALGSTPITDTTGALVTSGAPAAGLSYYRWPVVGMPVSLDFAAGTYVAGDQFTVATSRTVSRVNVNSGAGAAISPAIAVTPPAQGTQVSAPPAVNTATAGTSGTSSTSGGGGGTQVGIDVNIDYSMQKLQQSGAIKITIIRQQEGHSIDDMQKEAMDLIKEDLLKDFFKTQMTSSPSPVQQATSAMQSAQNATTANTNKGTTGGGTRVDIGFQLQEKKEEELRTMTFSYDVQAPETRTHAPNGFFSALITKTNKADLIKEIPLDDDFFKNVEVTASSIADFSTIDLKTVVLDMAYGGTSDAPSALSSPTFTAADNNPKTFQSFIENGEMSYRYRSSYYFGQNDLVGAQTTEYHTDWRTTLSRAVVVNPPIDVPMLHVYLAPGLIDWDMVARVETVLTYDDPDNHFHATRAFMIDPTFSHDNWIVRLTDPTKNTYGVQHTWIMKDSNRRITGPVVQMQAPQLFVFDPFIDRLQLRVLPEVDATAVSRVTLAFHYEDKPNNLDVRKLVELAPPFNTTTVYLPLMDSKKRSYAYQLTLYKVGGGAENRPEVTTDQTSIIVTQSGMPRDISVSLIGDLTQAGLTGLQVDLRTEPADGDAPKVESHLFEPAGDKKWVQRLIMRIDRPDHTYEVQTTAFYPDKDPVQSDWNEHDTSILVLQPSRLQS